MTTRHRFIPSNHKTLFLRNLEMLLLDYGLMEDEDLVNYRKNACPNILNLMQNYDVDLKEKNTNGMLDWYKDDTFYKRFKDERINLLNSCK